MVNDVARFALLAVTAAKAGRAEFRPANDRKIPPFECFGLVSEIARAAGCLI